MTAPSHVYAGLSASDWPCMELNRGNGLGCCVVGQQLSSSAALEVNVNKLHIYGQAQE